MDNDSLDGTELETTQEAAPAASEQPAEQPGQVATEQQPQTDVSNIPEEFRNLSPDEWFNRYNKANSQVGRYKKEVDNLQQRMSQYEQMLKQLYSNSDANQQSTPSSLPGNEARPGQQQDVDFWDDPNKAAEMASYRGAQKVMQEYMRQQQEQAQQQQTQRAQWIRNADDRALSKLRLDKGDEFTEDHELMMQVLTKKDEAAIKNKLSAPNLTEQDIENLVTEYYNKADQILRGPKDQAQKVFHQAQKEAATNGAPQSRAQTGNQPQEDEFPEAFGDRETAERFAFLWK